MKTRVRFLILLALSVFLNVPETPAYNFCGFHDRGFTMTAIHWNSEFWVDMVVAEANKWNAVHPVLTINRERRDSVPLGRDGQNIIGWIAEADLNRAYGLSWVGSVGWTISWNEANCGRVLEVDQFYNPAITLFTPQTQVPYNLGFQEIALHEMGHVLTLGHEDGSLSVMTTGQAVSNVLHHNDKVGWRASAAFRFTTTDRRDMGVFPIQNNGANKIYTTLSPATVRRGTNFTINNFTVENLSSAMVESNPTYHVFLESTIGGGSINIGWFSWGPFCAFCAWSGSLTYRVPDSIAPGAYRVTAVFQGSDTDNSNDRAVFGTINVTP